MTHWWLGVALLLLLAALFLLRPLWFSRRLDDRSSQAANLEWYKIRRDELSVDEQAAVLDEDAQLRLLEDGLEETQAIAAERDSPWLPLSCLVVVVALAAGLYWQLGARGDVTVTRALQGLGPDSTEADFRQVMELVEARALQRPDNLNYQAMLGRFYMNSGDYGRAQTVYQGLAERAPEDATALAMAAQSSFLAAGRRLEPQGRLLAEQALAIDPHQATALGLLGMVSFEEGSYRAAIEYWQRLVAMEDPASENAQMINGVIDRARQALAASGESAPAPRQAVAAAPAAVSSGAAVSVRVTLPEGATPAPTDTVFVFARDAISGARMPVAVQRFTAAELPRTVILDDAAAMAGQRISALEQVLVIARVSPGGQPGAANATFEGQVGPLQPSAEPEPAALALQAKKI